MEDRVVWVGGKTGAFSVKSAYWLDQSGRFEQNRDEVWKKLWKAKINEGWRILLWRIAVGALPVRARLAARLNLLNSTCCLCGEEDKTEIHLFQTCLVARMVWVGAIRGLKWEDLEQSHLLILFLFY